MTDQGRLHLDSVNDTGEAYVSYHGWVLTCLWCDRQVRGQTKAEAVAKMQRHYDETIGSVQVVIR